MHFIKIYWLLYPALPKHLPMRTLYLIAALAQIPNTSAAKITFCQMQQLCSFTSMSSAQSLQLLWPVSLFPSQSFSLRKWWTICLLCLFRSQLFKSALTLLRPFVKKTEHAFSNSLHKNCGVFFPLQLQTTWHNFLLFEISCFQFREHTQAVLDCKEHSIVLPKKTKQRLQFYKLCKVLILNG